MASKKDKDNARKKARQAARQQAKQSQKGASSTIAIPSGLEFFNPPENDSTTLGILPFVAKAASKLLPKDVAKGDKFFRVTYLRHRDVGPEEHKVICPTSFGKACPICEEFNKQKKGDAEWDDIKGLRPSKRELYLVVYKEKLKLMDMPYFWFGEQLDIEISDDDSEDIFFFPEDGIDVRATWKKDDFGSKAKATRFRKRKEDIDEELIEKAEGIDLTACVVETSYKDVEGMMHGVAPDDEDEPDDEPTTNASDDDDDKGDDDAGDDNDKGDDDAGDDDSGDDDGPPKCFGKEYDKKDEDCQDCDEAKKCKKACKGDDDKDKDKDKGGKSGKSGKGKKGKEDCPHEHKFGKDWDEFDECDDCENESSCQKASKE